MSSAKSQLVLWCCYCAVIFHDITRQFSFFRSFYYLRLLFYSSVYFCAVWAMSVGCQLVSTTLVHTEQRDWIWMACHRKYIHISAVARARTVVTLTIIRHWAAPQAGQRFLSREMSQHTVKFGLAQTYCTDIGGTQMLFKEFGEPPLRSVLPLLNSHVVLRDFSGKHSIEQSFTICKRLFKGL